MNNMALRALLVSPDDGTTPIITSVLSEFSVKTQHSAYPEGLFALPEYKLDALLVDFDNASQAAAIVQSIRRLPSPPITVAILKDQSSLRAAFAAGAHFVLYKPISEEKAHASLKAAVALMTRERRRCFRVPLQVPVQLQLEDGVEREGIILDLSEEGMDVITAEPISPAARARARFVLPEGREQIELASEIAWGNPNGQSGMRFLELPESLRNTFKEFVNDNAPELPAEDLWQDSQCRLSDLSLGACYIRTESPFPERSVVEVCLCANDIEVSAEGTVEVMHPGLGMGIEFASRTASQREEVQNLLNFLTSCPGTLPKLTVRPRALFAPDHFHSQRVSAIDDPLLQLLRNHEALSPEEFLQELQKQRTQEVVSA